VAAIASLTAISPARHLSPLGRQYGSAEQHTTIRCSAAISRMCWVLEWVGHYAMAVVDDELRVRGITGFSIIDASVLPAVASTNTNAPTIMIAERAPHDPRSRAPADGAVAASLPASRMRFFKYHCRVD
jgi:hypothetical protein